MKLYACSQYIQLNVHACMCVRVWICVVGDHGCFLCENGRWEVSVTVRYNEVRFGATAFQWIPSQQTSPVKSIREDFVLAIETAWANHPHPHKTHLRAGAMHEIWVGAECDIRWRNNGLKLLCRQGSKLRWDHGIHLPMTLQNWSLLVSTSTSSLTNQQNIFNLSLCHFPRSHTISYFLVPAGRTCEVEANS